MSTQQHERGRVVIGMDPHKRSATIEVMTADETIVGGGRFGTDRDGYAAMRRYGRQWPDRVWAIEGCAGIGKHIAVRLLADGEEVVDVPPKLSARARVFATGQGRKTDATDAHSVALVGTRMTGLRPVVNDEQLAVLRLLVDRRRSLGEEHTRKISQLHQLLLELIPGGAKKDLSAAPGQGTAGQGPPPRRRSARPAAGSPRSWSATWSGSTPGRRPRTRSSPSWSQPPAPACWTCTASDPPAPPGCWSRSATSPGSRTRPTSRPGTAPHPSTPPPATRSATGCPAAGNRQINRVLHIMARVQLRNPTDRAATTTTARRPTAKHPWKPCAASNADSPTSSSRRCSTTPSDSTRRRAREDNGETTLTPARPAHIPTPALRTSHFPDPPTTA